MANGFKCIICGGKLVIQNTKVAVCENCGMEHSVESLRESMGTQNPAPASTPATSNVNYDNLFRMAKSAYESKDYKSALDYADQILMKDIKCADAWLWKIGSLVMSVNEYSKEFSSAAGYFADACNQIIDSTHKTIFIKKITKVFLEKAVLNEQTADTAQALARGNTETATAYVDKALAKATACLIDITKHCMRTTEDYSSRDYRVGDYYVLICETWNTYIGSYRRNMEEIKRIWSLCGQNCRISVSVYNYTKAVDNFITSGYKYLNSGEISKVKDSVSSVMRSVTTFYEKEKAENEAAYWAARPGEKERLDKEIAQTEKELRETEKKLNSLGTAEKIEDIERRISYAKTELAVLSAIRFKRKRELTEYIALLERELKEVTDRHNNEALPLAQKYGSLKYRLEELKSKRNINS